MQQKDLTGMKFGRLTVIKQGEDYIAPKSGLKSKRWWCKCDCGNPKMILSYQSHLKNGHAKSCGCLKKENQKKSVKKYNTYDLTGDYGIGFTVKGEEFYFDLEDYDKIKDYCWKISSGYVCTNVSSENADKKMKHIRMHRLIMGVHDETMQVDHIHGRETTNDNRKSNLRIATPSQNQMNKVLMKNNTSNCTGVYFLKKEKKWIVYIGKNNKKIYLGRFFNKDDAIKARKEAEEKYFGEWSYDNSQAM